MDLESVRESPYFLRVFNYLQHKDLLGRLDGLESDVAISGEIQTLRSVPRAIKKRNQTITPNFVKGFTALKKVLVNYYIPNTMRDYIQDFKREAGFGRREAEDFFQDLHLRLSVRLFSDIGQYGKLLPAFLSQVSIAQIPKELLAKVKGIVPHEKTTHTATIILNPYKYVLCSSSEPYIEAAMQDSYKATIVLGDDQLLMKYYGRPAALCLKSFTTAEGISFIRGNWYTPIGVARKELKKAFDDGEQRISEITGKWVLIRQLNENYFGGEERAQRFMTRAEKYSETMPAGKLSEADAQARRSRTYQEGMSDEP